MALPMKKAPAMKAMKAMKAMSATKAMKGMKSSGKLTATGAYSAIAEKTGLKTKQVREATEAYMALAAAELKKSGQFKFGGALNMKLKKKPARPARKGVNPFTKEPCVFKAKPASQTVRALPMKKLKEMIN
eukprot:TRINITY_DN1834_c0_g2_i3.p2 TRINITY_DN1834_c0_g2~~TRINITY_DN1834_c0_g2_i3.p2  ORF type:complete len:141 (-),score=54.41 TRINITY_DN1834_c0_g2_i3:102-494(-)